MGFFVQNVNQNNSLVPDGEYKARVTELKLSQKGDTVIVRCELLTEGFEKTIVTGFCGAHWNPSTRTTANLRQWCINLGMNVVRGHEEELDLDELKGRECRVIIQGYRSKTGEDRCKISNILPLERRAAINPTIKTGLHVSNQQAPVQQQTVAPQQAQTPVQQTVMPSQINTPVQATAPVAQQTAQPAVESTSEDDLW